MEKKFVVCEKMEANDNEQSVVGWGSKPIPDRDNELIESSAWNLDTYRKNPVLMLCHDYSTPPVGKCLWIKTSDQGLRFKAKFASTERGKEVYQLYKEGIMSAFSVGFKPRPDGLIDNPKDNKYKGLKRVYTNVDLLEISCVPIPSNSEALVDYVKSGKIQTKQLKDELDHVIEIIERGEKILEVAENAEDHKKSVDEITHTEEDKREEVEGLEIVEKGESEKDAEKDEKEGTFQCESCGKDSSEKETCPECGGKMKVAEKKEEEKKEEGKEKEVSAVEQKVESVDKPPSAEESKELCPAGGVFGVNYKKFEECETCSQAGKCEEESTKKSISIYDIVASINKTLKEGSYVVDVYPTEFPSGKLVYSGNEDFVVCGYVYDMKNGTVTLGDDEKVISKSWVFDRYGISENDSKIVKDDEEVVVKEGRVLSGKNRTLIQNAVSALNDLLSATDRPEKSDVSDKQDEVLEKDDKDDDGIEIITKDEDEDEIEIVAKSDDEPIIEIVEKKETDNLIEVDEEQLGSVLKKVFGEVLKGSVEDGVIVAMKKAQGKVT